ncbi:MAG: hypothetical protein Ta2A_18820 [Treponemataceae bacterium]|nr:MAG: hypothetical protein Ta2A_18820 [Treponemataceae bacterium]
MSECNTNQGKRYTTLSSTSVRKFPADLHKGKYCNRYAECKPFS